MHRSDVERILITEGYQITKDGQVFDSKNTFLTNMIVVPKSQIRKSINGKEEMYAIAKISVDGQKEIKINLPALELYKLQWIPMKLGMHAIIADGRKNEFLLILKKLFKEVEIVDTYNSIGWVKSSNGKLVYSDSDGAITNDRIKVDIDEHLSNYRFSRKDIDVSKAAKASLSLLNVVDKGSAYVLMALVFLCPLLEYIGKVSKLPEFVVWLYGFTGTRKTTIAKLFASYFGDFDNRVTASFNDTYSSIELKAYKLKDSLMLLDDFCPQQSFKETQNINTIAEKVVRAYGDRTSRGRLNVTMESHTQFIPRGMALITGETIVPGNSTVARVVPLELKKESVNLEQLTEAQKNTELLTVVMREYILWIANEVDSNRADFLETIKENYKCFLDEIKVDAIETHGRTYEAFAWLLVALDMMYQFHCSHGVISKDEADEGIEEAKSEFLELIKAKHELSKSDNPVDLFIETIKEFITSKEITLKNLENEEVIGNQYKPMDGYFDSEFYYFNANNIYGLVRSKLLKAGIYMQLPVRGLLKALADNGVIKVEDTSNLPKKSIKNGEGTTLRPRMLHIRKEFLE